MKFDAPELTAIEPSKAEKIKATFEPMAEMLTSFEDAYNELMQRADVEITQEVTKDAKRLRLNIGRVRIETEKIRKAEKEEYLRAGKAIDGVSNILKWAVTDKENRLKEIEEYFEIQERKRLEALQEERVEALSAYVEDAHERNLSGMDDDVWAAYLNAKKQEYQDRIEAERKAAEEMKEQERLDRLENQRRIEIAPYLQYIDDAPELREMSEDKYNELLAKCKVAKSEHDKEKERIRKENERLQKEREELERKAEKERKEREAAIEKERKEREAALQKERKERERVEAEIRKREEAEAKARREAEAAERARLKAPDKEKLIYLAEQFQAVNMPVLTTDEGKAAVKAIQELQSKLCKFITDKANTL